MSGNNKQCLYNVFNCKVFKVLLRHKDISDSVFKDNFDFYRDYLRPIVLDYYLDLFLSDTPDRSIKDICNHIDNICKEYFDLL